MAALETFIRVVIQKLKSYKLMHWFEVSQFKLLIRIKLSIKCTLN